MNVLLYRHMPCRHNLKMKVIGCRGAASWAVIKNRPVRTEIGCELEEGIDLPPDSLGMVVETGYGEVKRENRHGIAEDQVFVPVPNPFLLFREMIQAKKAWTIIHRLFSHIGQGALHPSGVVLNAYREFAAGDVPYHHAPQKFIALSTSRPRFFLIREKFTTKLGKAFPMFPSFKNSVGLLVHKHGRVCGFHCFFHAPAFIAFLAAISSVRIVSLNALFLFVPSILREASVLSDQRLQR